MIKNLTLFSTLALLSTTAFGADDVQSQIDALNAKITKMEKINKYQNKQLSKVNKQSANDNIKFGVDFRNAVDALEYKDNDTGDRASNPSLLTSRLYLDMAASPIEGLVFKGRLAIYSMWGAHLNYTGTDDSAGLKDWSASSKATDTVMRIKEAYFVYSNTLGSQPVSFSIGRRPSTNGFLANYRENEKKPGSPLAHITNMEVNAAMLKLDWSRFIEGSYTKFVFGRAHTGAVENVYGVKTDPWSPYATEDGDDKNVDFFVMPGNAYDDGQYQIMYEWAHIFNTKGLNIAENAVDPTKGTAAAAGKADLFSVGFKVDGIGDEWSDFLDETTIFVSGAYTNYNAKEGYSLIGSKDGGSKSGSSIWVGAIIPDMVTDSGKIGIEYNHGSKYWTPMTWAEDTAIGSKIAVRGDAYEAYWNFNLFGVKYLPSQVRYTYAQHDFTPNVKCAGWVPVKEVDLTASDFRFAVTYRY